MKSRKIFCICTVVISMLMVFSTACFNQTTNSSNNSSASSDLSIDSSSSSDLSIDSSSSSDSSSSVEPEHAHTYSDKWSYSQTHHWHAATCGHYSEKMDYQPHTMEEGEKNNSITSYTCTVCNYEKLIADDVEEEEDVFIPEYDVRIVFISVRKYSAYYGEFLHRLANKLVRMWERFSVYNDGEKNLSVFFGAS